VPSPHPPRPAGAHNPGPAIPPGVRIGCAILGATGVVGQRFVERLHGHPWFELKALVGQDSAGKPYGDAVRHWLPDTPCPADVARQRVVTLEDLVARTDIAVVFSALPSGTAGPVETRLAALGFQVFTNARDHRMADHVPLLVPEINGDHLAQVEAQAGPGFVVANGNCSAIVLELPLAALHRAFGVESADVVTMQGLSGAGHPGVPALDAIDNVVPYIGGEEDKVETEPNKTLGRLRGGAQGIESAGIRIQATCTRVPVREGHLEAVHLRLARAATPAEVRAALDGFRGPKDLDACPTAPHRPIHVTDAVDRPQPRRDRDAEGGMAVTVGRLRLSSDGRDLRFLVLGHNTVRGAAGQSVLNAEFAFVRGVLRPRRATPLPATTGKNGDGTEGARKPRRKQRRST
jgi:aspartate-semialdehyde dehydrogenase